MKGKIFIPLLAMVLMLTIISISTATAGPNLCTKTSLDALQSCNNGAEDSYWLALGKCDNLPTQIRRKECYQAALEDENSAFSECRAQFSERQRICTALGENPYYPIIKPANFVTAVTNQYFPLVPGSVWVYDGITEKGNEHVEVTVTNETRVIMGVTCIAVRDTGTVDGVLEEDTIDWYAQDKDGNVWYFGENSLTYEDGLIVSLEGSWLAGVERARPGIVMKGNPQLGDLYRQEFALGVAEDMGKVIGLNKSVTVPAGTFNNCVKTKDFSPLEPGVVEYKFYAPGVGNVRVVDAITGEHLDLTSFTAGP